MCNLEIMAAVEPLNHLIKVMEVVCIFAVCCALVAAYDTIKQHHAIKQLDKQLKQSLTLK